MRKVVDELHQTGRVGFGVVGIGILVQMLLGRGSESDLEEAQKAIDRVANMRADEDWAVRDIWILRLRALLARPVPAPTRPRTATIGIDTAQWRNR